MRRILMWGLSTLSVVVLLFGYSTSTSGPDGSTASSAFVSGTTAGTSSTTSGSASTATGSGSSGTDSSGSASAGSGSSGSGSSSTVTGEVAETRWGPVQVELTMSGTTISSVSVLQYPDGNGRDEEINAQALPVLIEETTDAQSADIDMVSGATYTSEGYVQSLQSALDQVGA